MVTSRYLVGKDGLTAQERKRGRRCKAPVATFGELVWYKPMDKARERNTIEAKWEKGLWLGTAREANETLIGTKEGVTRCYAIKRMPEEDRWNAAEISGLKGTPQQPNPMKVGLHIPTRLPSDAALGGGTDGAAAEGDEETSEAIPEATAPFPDPLVRRTPITYKEIDKYGLTPGCVGCEAKSRGEVTRRGHSDKCRRRIEEAMRKDDEDKKKLDKADELITHKIAKDIEKQIAKERSALVSAALMVTQT